MPDSRTYPREWFAVSRFTRSLEPRTFLRESDQCLFYRDKQGREKRELKTTNFETWYPTAEEAQAAIDVFVARKAARQRKMVIAEAAEKLLEALVQVLDHLGALTNPSEFPNMLGIPQERGEEILAMIEECRNA